jgi:hypothetical protein
MVTFKCNQWDCYNFFSDIASQQMLIDKQLRTFL